MKRKWKDNDEKLQTISQLKMYKIKFLAKDWKIKA